MNMFKGYLSSFLAEKGEKYIEYAIGPDIYMRNMRCHPLRETSHIILVTGNIAG
jgi:hypothetical protein